MKKEKIKAEKNKDNKKINNENNKNKDNQKTNSKKNKNEDSQKNKKEKNKDVKSNKIKKYGINKIDLINVIMFLVPIMVGCFSLWGNFLIAILCIIGIFLKVKKNNKLIVPKGKNWIFICTYVFSFLLVEFYAIDKGMNLLGFFKNFTMILLIILYLQYEYTFEKKAKLINLIPSLAIFFLIVSVLFLRVGDIWFENRLQGIFMYANSYALFLLLGIIVILMKENINIKEVIEIVVLFIGIIFTNSRAIILLSFFTTIICVLVNSNNRKKLICILGSLLVIFGLVYCFSGIEKRLTLDLFESGEFTLRKIYYKDAWNMILENPFGYGYMGYQYEQAKSQSTMYDTMFVHNSLLQIALDVGVIPLIAIVVLLVNLFKDKKQTKLNKILLGAIFIHSLIDIDFEYMLFSYLICFMINFEISEVKSKKINVPLIILGIIYLDFFIGTVSYAMMKYDIAYRVIPFYTKAKEEELYRTREYDKQVKLAKEIYKLNRNISGVYEALSNEERKNKNFDKALEYEKERLKLNKFFLEDYLIYLNFLLEALEYNKELKNEEKILKYEVEIVNLENLIEEATKDTTVEINLPNEIKAYINGVKNKIN